MKKMNCLEIAMACLAGSLFLTSCTSASADESQAPKKAKYVFYFITDGTGVNTVLGAEMYRAALEGRIGVKPFLMTQLPIVGMSTTYSANNGVTDSAASGTALATGHKTKNRTLGLEPDLETSVSSIAVWAKNAGMRVGVASSVGVNHATPAAFYSHVPSRNQYYQIGLDMISSQFDFYGGGVFLGDVDTINFKGYGSLYEETEKAGYTIAYGYDDYKAKADSAKQMVLFQTKEKIATPGNVSLPYYLDRDSTDLTIEQMLQAEINFLMKDSTKGFFLMNEIGGKVDWACHASDAAAAFAELQAVDNCINVAYQFYLQHPEETLIVLTADHETGGFVLGSSEKLPLNLAILANQKVSQDGFTAILHGLRKATSNKVTWEQAHQVLSENFGFWKTVELTPEEEKSLKDIYLKSFVGKMPEVANEYTKNEPLAAEARRIINSKAGVNWTTGGHSAGLVPVYAVGVGAEQFATQNDNALIPMKIARIAGILPAVEN